MTTTNLILKEDGKRGANLIWREICNLFNLKGKKRSVVALILCLLIILAIKRFLPDFITKKDNGDQVAGDESAVEPLVSSASPQSKLIIDDNCYTEWIDFSANYWEGLISRFEEVNGVYTIPDVAKRVDSVAYYSKPCKGNIKADIEFIAYSENLINFNIYYGNWFRWEIGGRDLNSVKLYKNDEGCTAFKKAREVTTENKYLSDGEKMMSRQPIWVSMFVFLTIEGKLRTELHIEFTSLKSGKVIKDRDSFYYEFDVGWKCDKNTLLDIDKDSERVGVGLMRSSQEGDELPRVKFQRFKVEKYM